MCGIIGFAGKTEAVTVLLDGLERLEYRGCRRRIEAWNNFPDRAGNAGCCLGNICSIG